MAKETFTGDTAVNTSFMQKFVQEGQVRGSMDATATDCNYVPTVNAVRNGTYTNVNLTAGNVSSKINGKSIGSIFETNGTTVKNATNATNASNAVMADLANTAMSYNSGNWSIVVANGNLCFNYGGVTKFRFTTDGYIDITP